MSCDSEDLLSDEQDCATRTKPVRHKVVFIIKEDGTTKIIREFDEELEDNERDVALQAAHFGCYLMEYVRHYISENYGEGVRLSVRLTPIEVLAEDVAYLPLGVIWAFEGDTRSDEDIIETMDKNPSAN